VGGGGGVGALDGVDLGLLGAVEQAEVVRGAGADEHAGARAVQRGRDDAGVLERLPRGLEQQAVPGVDVAGLAGADPEELCVEPIDVFEERAVADVALASDLRIAVGERVDVPALRRDRADGVLAAREQRPQAVEIDRAAGEAEADADDGDRRGSESRGGPRAGGGADASAEGGAGGGAGDGDLRSARRE